MTGITYARGFTAGGIACGIKASKKLDLMVALSAVPATAAAVYTRNRVVAAPLVVTRRHLGKGKVRAIVCNSGVANACTGSAGERDAVAMARLTARRFALDPHQVVVASTGVIGHRLPMDRVAAGIAKVELAVDGGARAAHAIMTTDLHPKEWHGDLGKGARLGGMAKGSGMIAPNMATMLAFLTTDAQVEPRFLRRALREAVDESFNQISVDGDTSTNDMVVVLANGLGGPVAPPAFAAALRTACTALAKMVVADGEGATKLFAVEVRGAATTADARRTAQAVARSTLVKCALYGSDPNWGRIVCAAGYSGAAFALERLAVRLGPIEVFRNGLPRPFDRAAARGYLDQREVEIGIDLRAGRASSTAWGCDLSPKYVTFNGHYTT
jgi:glutamate N-acetyltransferase/amino-acid N-acetyltransferase